MYKKNRISRAQSVYSCKITQLVLLVYGYSIHAVKQTQTPPLYPPLSSHVQLSTQDSEASVKPLLNEVPHVGLCAFAANPFAVQDECWGAFSSFQQVEI